MHPQPNAYDRKARLYAKHRWDYPQPAIDQIIETAGLTDNSIVADIGSGPGMLARHFLPLVKTVYAIEPGFDMRKVADDLLGAHSNFRSIRGTAEATTLPDHSVDLITAGMSIHWFDPALAVPEFRRILRPSGQLAIVRYSIVEQEIGDAIGELLGSCPAAPKRPPNCPPEAFLDVHTEKCFSYTSPRRDDLERFLGAQLSAAGAPTESEANYHSFRDRAQSIFERYAKDGLLTLTQRTELRIGRVG